MMRRDNRVAHDTAVPVPPLWTAFPNDLILERGYDLQTGAAYRLALDAFTFEWRTQQLAEAAALAMAECARVAVYMRHDDRLEFIGDYRARVTVH